VFFFLFLTTASMTLYKDIESKVNAKLEA